MADEVTRSGALHRSATDGPSPSGSRWTALLRHGLGRRLVLAQVFVAAAILAVAGLGLTRVQAAEKRLLRVYDHRVIPLQRLQEVTDLFAIDFVDDVHKVSDGSIDRREGIDTLLRVRDQANAKWVAAEVLMTTPQERAVLDKIRPVFRHALDGLSEALELMNAVGTDHLRRWRATGLYTGVDPLTAQLHALVGEELENAHGDVLALRLDLARSARQSTVILVLASAFAVLMGLNVASRFLGSLRRIERVVRAASAGDLSGRVKLLGTDELATMAAQIDHMIESVQLSQAALARSEAETRAASASKSIFLSNVSHELRTPLNVILGYAQVLQRDGKASKEHLHGLTRILEAGNHLLQLIDDVLGIARLEASTLTVQLGAFSPAGLVEEAGRMLSSRADAKGLVWQTEIDGPLPELVQGDRRRVLQVLLNLGGNAIKFTARGSVTLRAAWRDPKLLFEVVDTGPGISEGEQALLFQTFTQGEAGRSSGEGTGLGLYISQSIARLLGGDLTLTSELGVGSCFSLTVVAPREAAGAEPPALRPLRRLAAGVELAPMLVVDDRDTNREVLRALLEGAGFAVEEAADGQVAFDRIARGSLSLVWTDLKMPVLDGFELVRLLRDRESALGVARLPVVAITASVANLSVEEARALGFDALLAKPFRADNVLDTVEQLLVVKLAEEPVSGADPGPQPFDLARLSEEVRAPLLAHLVRGDTAAAVALLENHPLAQDARALCREILSFRSDPAIAKLRSLALK